MSAVVRLLAVSLLVLPAVPALATPAGPPRIVSEPELPIVWVRDGISRNPSDYSNGYGTNAANSRAVQPVTPYGGYVVNQYGFGNYVSGPLGFGGYPAGSAGAQIWRQREQWKCENVPESC